MCCETWALMRITGVLTAWQHMLQSMQMVFTDQLSNTGINLIAASSGSEFALEGKRWNNGVFAYALLNGWDFGARENRS